MNISKGYLKKFKTSDVEGYKTSNIKRYKTFDIVTQKYIREFL